MSGQKYEKVPLRQTVGTHVKVKRLASGNISASDTKWYEYTPEAYCVKIEFMIYTGSIDLAFDRYTRDVEFRTTAVTSLGDGTLVPLVKEFEFNPQKVYYRRTQTVGTAPVFTITETYITPEEYDKYLKGR